MRKRENVVSYSVRGFVFYLEKPIRPVLKLALSENLKAPTHQADIGRLALLGENGFLVAQSKFGVSRTLGRDAPYLAFHGRHPGVGHKLSGQETTLISCSASK